MYDRPFGDDTVYDLLINGWVIGGLSARRGVGAHPRDPQVGGGGLDDLFGRRDRPGVSDL